MPAGFQFHLAQPACGVGLNRLPRLPAQQQRHGHILKGRELGKQVMKLPYKSQFAAAKLSRCIVGEPSQIDFGEVYVTLGSSIKNSEDVQQGTLARARFANNGEHLSGLHLERQILKEH